MGAPSQDAMTYVPDETEVKRLNESLSRLAPGDSSANATLTIPNVGTIEVPDSLAETLALVLRAVAAGEGITIVPRNAVLTTQESADVLGISRPTLVRLLEKGEIPFTLVGRHRRVRLADIDDYQRRSQKTRSDALARMVSIGEEADMYRATSGVPPRTR